MAVRSVSTATFRMFASAPLVKTTAYLSLGSNLGDRAHHLRQAISALGKLGRVSAVSSFYETEPVEVETQQPWFINAVVALGTELAPQQLLSRTLEIEREMGRRRTLPKEPRVIDIDIVMFGGTILNTPGLIIPHPAMHHRRFVLEPLAEIAPQVEHPLLRKSAAGLLGELPRSGDQVHRLEGPQIQNQKPDHS